MLQTNIVEIQKTISDKIETQFPEVYREDGPVLVDFITAYFEYLEQNDYSSTTLSRNMLSHDDIDTTLDEFLVHFKDKYLNNFPYILTVDTRFAIKHIMDFYRSKGTPNAVKLLMRMLFNEDADVYNPEKDILKLSDSQWITPRYIEVTRSSRSKGFLDKMIYGSISGSTAFVEGVITKQIQGRLIDVIYLSQIKGIFVTGELVTDDTSNYVDSPKIIGSLSGMNIINGGQNNVIGDIYNVIHESGQQGKVRVTGTENATGRVTFNLIDGGSGYTLNTPYDNDDTNDYTGIYVATAMIGVDNPDNTFIKYETLQQDREDLSLVNATNINTEYQLFSPGDYLLGVRAFSNTYSANGAESVFERVENTDNIAIRITNSSVTNVIANTSEYTTNSSHVIFSSNLEANTLVSVIDYIEQCTGIIDYISNTSTGNTEINTSSANSITRLVLSSNGTFAQQLQIDFSNTSPYFDGETVEEQSTIILTTNNVSGSFSNGDLVEMKTLSDPSEIGNNELIISYAYGTVADNSNGSLILEPAWGDFNVGEEIAIYEANGNQSASASIANVIISNTGATGVLNYAVDLDTWLLHTISGEFSNNTLVRGRSTNIEELITSIENVGATEVWYNGDPLSNGNIQYVSNSTVSGFVVGQNTTVVGLYGNTLPFSYVESANMSITLDRTNTFAYAEADTLYLDSGYIEDDYFQDLEDLGLNTSLLYYVLPGYVDPGYAEIITSLFTENFEINFVGTGSGATFEPGSLEYEEVDSLNTDFVNRTNIVGIPYINIALDGSNSGIGYVQSIAIEDGGSGYSNGGSVTFAGGGFSNGNPIVPAYGEIITDANGSISDITLLNQGEGYFSEPTVNFPSSNTSANISLTMKYGYGFPKNPYGDVNTAVDDILTYQEFTLGSIASLSQVNPGSNYNISPFISVFNPYSAAYYKRNIILFVDIQSGSFKVGETVTQDTDIKGVVVSYNSTMGELILKRLYIDTTFSSSFIIGSESGAVAEIDEFFTDNDSNEVGDNIIIDNNVVIANGVVTSVEVISSGFGYLGNTEMTLISSNTNQTINMTANSIVETQGIAEGYWNTKTSHISDIAKIQDSKYYQAFSYDIQSGVSINRYRDIVKNVLHVAGTELFGTVIKSSINNEQLNVVDSSVTVD